MIDLIIGGGNLVYGDMEKDAFSVKMVGDAIKGVGGKAKHLGGTVANKVKGGGTSLLELPNRISSPVNRWLRNVDRKSKMKGVHFVPPREFGGSMLPQRSEFGAATLSSQLRAANGKKRAVSETEYLRDIKSVTYRKLRNSLKKLHPDMSIAKRNDIIHRMGGMRTMGVPAAHLVTEPVPIYPTELISGLILPYSGAINSINWKEPHRFKQFIRGKNIATDVLNDYAVGRVVNDVRGAFPDLIKNTTRWSPEYKVTKAPPSSIFSMPYGPRMEDNNLNLILSAAENEQLPAAMIKRNQR